MANYTKRATLFRCPISGEALHYEKNESAIAEFLDTLETDENHDEVKHGFFNTSKTVFYPIIDDIIILLPEKSFHKVSGVKSDKKILNVKKFYDEFGWNKNDSENYNDGSLYVDTRDIAEKYHNLTTQRAAEFLKSKGKYLLDVASGPVYQKDYLHFSRNFEKRICVDISIKALQEAKKNVGVDQGIFVLGDITNLPLNDDVCDNVVSFHTIYHVPKEKQLKAIQELLRVCKEESNVVIAYNWAWHSWPMNLILLPIKAIKAIRRFNRLYLKSHDSGDPAKILYFHPHRPSWFKKNFGGNKKIELSFHCLQSIDEDFIKYYIHEKLYGKKLLDYILNLEKKYSAFFGKHGAYPLIVISKKN